MIYPLAATRIIDPVHDNVAYRVSTVQIDDTYETAVFTGEFSMRDEVDFVRSSTPWAAIAAHNELAAKWTKTQVRRRFALPEEPVT